MQTSIVYVDSTQSASHESGDIIKSGAGVYAEIGEVILGTKEAMSSQRTIFKSLGLHSNYKWLRYMASSLYGLIIFCCSGMALEDAVSAQLVYKQIQRARENFA